MELALNIPQNYVEIDEQEMMYLDGGGYWRHVGHAEWTYTFTKRDFNKIASAINMGIAVSAAIVTLTPDPTIKPIAGSIAAISGIASAFLTFAASWTNGFRIYFHTMWWGRQPRWAQFI